jgi:hypothetical protein
MSLPFGADALLLLLNYSVGKLSAREGANPIAPPVRRT